MNIMNDSLLLKELLEDIFENKLSKIDSKFDIINYKLDQIEKQTTKTNGRVTELEKKINVVENQESTHVMRCPNIKRIESLEKESISTNSIKRFTLIAIGLTGTAMTILFALYKMITGS